MNTNKFQVNNKTYKFENNKLYIQHCGEWLRVKDEEYSLSSLTSTRRILIIGLLPFLLQNNRLSPIKTEPLFEDTQPCTVFISPNYKEEEKYRIIFAQLGNRLHVLGRTFEEVADNLWKIGSCIYTRGKDGSLEFLQNCRNFETIGGDVRLWDGEKNYSSLYVYRIIYGRWKKISYRPFMSGTTI